MNPDEGGARPARARLRLKPGRQKPIVQGHPWVFSGAVDAAEGPEDAPLAEVVASDGRRLGTGLYSPRSQIRVRLLAGADEPVDRGLFAARLGDAVRLREAILPPATDGYRVINAEGDGLPAWTVDRYGQVLVSQITSAGLEALRDEAYAALEGSFPAFSVLQANDLAMRRLEGLALEDEAIRGEPGVEALFRESGLIFAALLGTGQKTGFYCDQRENRRLVERLAAGRRVLDLFAHTGAFGIYALRGGAAGVTHVESAPRLIEHGRRHYGLNRLPDGAARWLQADAFELLRELEEAYDLVVCDPPPLARRRADLEAGARAYKDLNRLALRRLAPGGLLFTFTCSGAVDATLFRQILFSAAVEAGVSLSLLAPLSAAPDHPVAVTHPQGEYLKGWMAMVRG